MTALRAPVDLRCGDARAVLATLPAGCCQMAVTSPPYYQKRAYHTEPQVWGGDDPGCEHEWHTERRRDTRGTAGSTLEGTFEPAAQRHDTESATCTRCGAWSGELGQERDVESFVAHLVAVFRAVKGVLRPDGTCWVNLGDSYSNSGRSNRAGSKRQKPGWTSDAGVGEKQLLLVPARFALAMQADGWVLRNALTLCKTAPMPESATDRFTSATEMLYLFAARPRYYIDMAAIRERQAAGTLERFGNGRAPRQVNGPKYANAPDDVRPGEVSGAVGVLPDATRNPRDWMLWRPEVYNGPHYAAYPTWLPALAIRAGTSARGCCKICGAPWARVREGANPSKTANVGVDMTGGAAITANPQTSAGLHRNGGGVFSGKRDTGEWAPTCKHADAPTVPQWVLDPFAGTGTTLAVARQLGRHAVGIDLQPDYRPQQEARLAALTPWYAEGHGAGELDGWEGTPLFAALEGRDVG